MAARPRIGVTGTARRWSPGWWSTALALRLVGATPERISVHHKPSGKPLDALVIGGGDDISPEHYHGDLREKVKADPERDLLEIRWIERALREGLPLLGICRGAQLINVVLGGDLHMDIGPLRRKTYNRPGLLPTKQVFVESGTLLGELTGKSKLRVNSLHHQAINRLGNGLRVVGRDLDDFVQAVEGTNDQQVVGVQWHPEYLLYLPSHLALFRWLVRAGRA
ncbi:gamma-glutamyl-gamma-aminobutyrate hydrolase family protein [Microbulbifer yueqingensis]|uniref:Putative glutamine amidotransferase n=1 Tax=Microbulbifer yueqingensis TaxID=658219 RepID=A0A1G9CXR7_9GAMM|nr:gamma-glutamyl-gamma-aminobutyrate hydrolase family protein [Microbulbifer yueqingensis]SDK56413.1 putative glutamine amidotransferase [Microbulbifer yueqingensis]